MHSETIRVDIQIPCYVSVCCEVVCIQISNGNTTPTIATFFHLAKRTWWSFSIIVCVMNIQLNFNHWPIT